MRVLSARRRYVAAVLCRLFAVFVGVLLGAFALATPVAANVTTVTNTSDVEDGVDGGCSLREAIRAVHNQAAFNECSWVVAAGTDRIEFAIPGSGVQTINVTQLPQLGRAVIIDGYTQPGASVNTDPQSNNAVLLMHLQGEDPTIQRWGFHFRVDGAVLRGFIISGFAYGVLSDANNVTIEGNRIGTSPDGTTAAPNRAGVDINGGTAVTIGGTTLAARNLISGNLTAGVYISSHVSGVAVMGNDIGVTASGFNALPNGTSGVQIVGGTNHQVGGGDGTTPGGICSGACNIISGNTLFGIYLDGTQGGTSGHRIWGNRIGLRRNANDLAIPNGASGIMIEGSANNEVGGGTAATRNVISGNASRGIEIRGAASTGNVVRGNFIGTSQSGQIPRGNTDEGVIVWIGAPNNTVGGTAGTTPGGNCTGDCNLLSGNRTGVSIDSPGSTGNRILGNFIGTNVSGSGAVPTQRHGIEVSVGNTVIGGTTPQARNLVSGNTLDGIRIHAPTQILGNYIGVNAAGTAALGNGRHGLSVESSQTGTVVGGIVAGSANLISGNIQSGVVLASAGVQLLGNLIGTDKDGLLAVPNQTGVTIISSNSQIGGPTASARNIISGNNGPGIAVLGAGASATQIQGNLIGLHAGGGTLPNLDDGVLVDGAPNASIGAVATGAANVISGNDGAGVHIRGAGATSTQILGNLIGTTTDGSGSRGNQASGILIESAPGVTIGGGTQAARNVIAGNGSYGINIAGSTGHTIRGNLIGTTVSGAPTLGNASAGVALLDVASTIIGGATAGEGNTIAGNGGHGLIIRGNSSTGNGILGNSIYSNIGQGIDLNDDGVTLNDSSDSDGGPNQLQNFPVLTGTSFTNTSPTRISGTLTSAPSTTYRIELFGSTAVDPTGYGEGQVFLGATSIATDSSGAGLFNIDLPQALPVGQIVTATATDPQNNTSEFAQVRAVAVSSCTPRPQVTVSTANNGDGRLRVTITSSETAGATANRLSAIAFKPGTNALVDIAGQTGRTGAFTVPLSDRPAGTTFFVRRATPGQATQLPFTVIDDCGGWPTFVGGGPSAF